MVATQQQQHQLALGFAFHHNGFQRLRNRHGQKIHQCGNGFDIRGGHFGQALSSGGALAGQGQGGGQFYVGGVIGSIAVGNDVFAGLGQHLEFVRAGAADTAGIGGHRAVIQPQAVEDAAIGIVHILVGLFERIVIAVERIGVFHHKFARTHHAETRAHFVAEFGLDMVEIERQLLVGAHFAAHDVGNHFFAGGGKAKITLVAVLQAQQLFAVKFPATGLLP